MSEQVIIELIVLYTAFIIGLAGIRHMSPFFLLIFIQLTVWICFYSILHWLTAAQVKKGLPPNNQWLMNIHMVIETFLLYAAAFIIKKDKILRMSVAVSAFVFVLIFFIQLMNQGIWVYMNYADIAECLTVAVLFIQIGFFYSRDKASKWIKSPELVVGLGLLLYFGGSVPYISMMHYIQKMNPKLNHLLFDFISNVLANVRYLLTALAFFLVYRNAQQLKKQV